MSYRAKKQHARPLTMCYSVGEPDMKEPSAVQFQQYDILKKMKLNTIKRSVISTAWEEGTMSRWSTGNV